MNKSNTKNEFNSLKTLELIITLLRIIDTIFMSEESNRMDQWPKHCGINKSNTKNEFNRPKISENMSWSILLIGQVLIHFYLDRLTWNLSKPFQSIYCGEWGLSIQDQFLLAEYDPLSRATISITFDSWCSKELNRHYSFA